VRSGDGSIDGQAAVPFLRHSECALEDELASQRDASRPGLVQAHLTALAILRLERYTSLLPFGTQSRKVRERGPAAEPTAKRMTCLASDNVLTSHQALLHARTTAPQMAFLPREAVDWTPQHFEG
jgi:hypothetical protein